MTMAKFTTPYTPTPDRYRPATLNDEEDMTQQSDKDDCDINVIMQRYATTGQLPQVQAKWLSGDFSDITDFRDAQDRIIGAREAFNELPALVREKFNNDPGEFIEFASNPENIDQMREMGLATPKENPQTSNTPAPTPPQTQGTTNGNTSTNPPAGGAPVNPAQGAG